MTSPTHTTQTSSSGEVYGARALYAAIVIGAVMLLVGAVWQFAPPAAHANTQQAQVTSQDANAG